MRAIVPHKLSLAEEVALLAQHGYTSADLAAMSPDDVALTIRSIIMRGTAEPAIELEDPNKYGAPMISTADALTEWMRIPAKPPARVVYYVGDLARFNYESPNRLVRLQKLADKSDNRPIGEAREMAEIQRVRELVQTVQFFASRGLLKVTQERINFGKWAYFAKKDGSR